jgi:hypothetical protein
VAHIGGCTFENILMKLKFMYMQNNKIKIGENIVKHTVVLGTPPFAAEYKNQK